MFNNKIVNLQITNINTPSIMGNYTLTYVNLRDENFNNILYNQFVVFMDYNYGFGDFTLDETYAISFSIQGMKGDIGSTGIQGLKGDTGSTGIQGLKGDTGSIPNYLISNNTWTQINTFSKNIINQSAPVEENHLTNKLYVDNKSNDSYTNLMSWSNIFYGINRFESLPSCAYNPIENEHLANKSYVDNKIIEYRNLIPTINIGSITQLFSGLPTVSLSFLNNIYSFNFGLVNATPIGVIVIYTGSITPPGYLLCNGEGHRRITYPDLFAILGTKYGGADQWPPTAYNGVYFGVPDLRNISSITQNVSVSYIIKF